jgi:hypothetical protein
LTNPTGEAENGILRLDFEHRIMVQFRANAVRLQLHALAYNLGSFLRSLAIPETIAAWSLTTLSEKLIKIGAKIVSHGRYVAFQMAEVAIPRRVFGAIVERIAALRSPPLATVT